MGLSISKKLVQLINKFVFIFPGVEICKLSLKSFDIQTIGRLYR